MYVQGVLRLDKIDSMERMKIVYISILLGLLVSLQAGAQRVTISNNLLYDAWLTPNLRVGVRVAPHWSVGVVGGYRPWPTDDNVTRKWRHLLVAPEVRYWTDSVDVHHFFGVNLIYSHYNVGDVKFPFGLYKSVRNERRQGDLGALGVFYGYSWPLGRWWNIEAAIGAAVGYTKYDRFECKHCGDKLGTEKKWFVMPQAAINIVYNIPGRPAKQPVWEEPYTVVPEPEPVQPIPIMLQPVKARPVRPDSALVVNASEYVPYDRTRILRKDKEALYIHFHVDKYDLDQSYRQNADMLDRIIRATQSIVDDSTTVVKKIQIVGLASIEGPVDRNEKLAQNRALTLQHYVQEKLNLPDSLFDTVGGGEGWADFRDQLDEVANNDSLHSRQLRQAIDIIDNENDLNLRERKLRRLNGGRTWKYIKENTLRDQRNSGYIRVFFDVVPDVNAQIINDASDLLHSDCSDCWHEALSMLQEVSYDERAQNALGVALWLCDRHDEALECWRKAAAAGNADAAENLRNLEKAVK